MQVRKFVLVSTLCKELNTGERIKNSFELIQTQPCTRADTHPCTHSYTQPHHDPVPV